MHLLINGKPEEIADVETTQDLLGLLDLTSQRVAVEVNGELVPRNTYESARLHEGDRVEIVTFVGGG